MVPQPLPKPPVHPGIKRAVFETITERVKGIKMPMPTYKKFLHHTASRVTVARMLILAEKKK
jgi:hypothetical protein